MKILVPYDGSQHCLDALRIVATMALSPGSEILILLIESEPNTWKLISYEERMLDRQDIIVRRSEHLKDLADELSLWQKECRVHYRVHFGQPVSSILETADQWHSDLIVLSTQERNRWGALIKGSISQTILDQASCSVLIVKPTEEVRSGIMGRTGYRVLLPIEGSFYSHETIAWLQGQPWRPGTQFKVLLAVEEFKELVEGGLTNREHQELSDQFLEARERAFMILEDHALKLGSKVGNDNLSIDVVPGEPGKAIVAAAKQWQPDIIAMGCHSATPLPKIMVGNIPDYVLKHSECTVLIVKNSLSKKKRKSRKKEGALEAIDSFFYSSRPKNSSGYPDLSPHGIVM